MSNWNSVSLLTITSNISCWKLGFPRLQMWCLICFPYKILSLYTVDHIQMIFNFFCSIPFQTKKKMWWNPLQKQCKKSDFVGVTAESVWVVVFTAPRIQHSHMLHVFCYWVVNILLCRTHHVTNLRAYT